jgi:hypothetical protein
VRQKTFVDAGRVIAPGVLTFRPRLGSLAFFAVSIGHKNARVEPQPGSIRGCDGIEVTGWAASSRRTPEELQNGNTLYRLRANTRDLGYSESEMQNTTVIHNQK